MRLREMYQDMGYHKQLVGLFLLIIVTALMEIFTIPYIVKNVLNIAIPEKNIRGLLILVIVHVFVVWIQCYMVLKHCKIRCLLSRRIKKDIRNKIFEKLQKVKAQFFDENKVGEILQLLQDDTEKAGQLFPIVITEMMVMGVGRSFIIAIFLLFVNIKIGLIILSFYLIGFLVTLFFNRKTIKRIAEIRRINADIYTVINEGIQSFFTIKILGIMQQKIQDLEANLNEYNHESSELQKIMSIYHTIFSFMISFSTIVIIYFGGMGVLEGTMTCAEIMLMMDYSNYLEHEFNWILKHLTDFNESFFAYSKILQMLEQTEEEDINKGEILSKKITKVEFDKVCFSYSNVPKNIKDISFVVNQNEKVAIIGKTGVRKNDHCEFDRKVI